MVNPSPLDDPETAAHAWARYRRLMRWMMLVTVTMVIGALVLLYRQHALVSIHFYIATALGISFAMLLMSALMLLIYLPGSPSALVWPYEWVICLAWAALGAVLYRAAPGRG